MASTILSAALLALVLIAAISAEAESSSSDRPAFKFLPLKADTSQRDRALHRRDAVGEEAPQSLFAKRYDEAWAAFDAWNTKHLERQQPLNESGHLEKRDGFATSLAGTARQPCACSTTTPYYIGWPMGTPSQTVNLYINSAGGDLLIVGPDCQSTYCRRYGASTNPTGYYDPTASTSYLASNTQRKIGIYSGTDAAEISDQFTLEFLLISRVPTNYATNTYFLPPVGGSVGFSPSSTYGTATVLQLINQIVDGHFLLMCKTGKQYGGFVLLGIAQDLLALTTGRMNFVKFNLPAAANPGTSGPMTVEVEGMFVLPHEKQTPSWVPVKKAEMEKIEQFVVEIGAAAFEVPRPLLSALKKHIQHTLCKRFNFGPALCAVGQSLFEGPKFLTAADIDRLPTLLLKLKGWTGRAQPNLRAPARLWLTPADGVTQGQDGLYNMNIMPTETWGVIGDPFIRNYAVAIDYTGNTIGFGDNSVCFQLGGMFANPL